MNVGGRWRHYRSAVELLKSEGWLYLTHSGPYRKASDFTASLPAFTQQIEHMIRADVSSYVTLVDTDTAKPATPDKPTAPAVAPSGASESARENVADAAP